MEAINTNKQEPLLNLGTYNMNFCFVVVILNEKPIADTNARKNFVKYLRKLGEVSIRLIV